MNGVRKLACGVVCALLAFAGLVARADIPQTVWNVTEPASSGKDASFSDGTGWSFKLTKAGSLSKTAVGTATALNFRTLELQCGYQIKSLPGSFFRGASTIEEVYFPGSLTTINGAYAFYQCTNLRVFAVPEDNSLTTVGALTFNGCSNLQTFSVGKNVIATIGDSAFNGCSKLTDLPIGSALTSIGKGAFSSCTVAKPPAGIKLFESTVAFPTGWNVIGGCAAVTGTVYIADDDKTTFSLGETRGALTGTSVQQLVLGAGLKSGNTATYGFTWSWGDNSTLTNVVIRNPDVFAIGSNDFEPGNCVNILTYDIAGWITGKAGGTAYKVCYLVNKSHPKWAAWAADANNYTLWADCSAANQQKYWNAHNGGVVGDEPPFALTKALTYEGLQFQNNYWVKFKKETAKTKSMIVHVDDDEKDYPSADPSRYPEYSVPCGSTVDMDDSGYTFPLNVCAPEYIAAKTALSNNLWRVLGGKMTELDYGTLEYKDYATIVGTNYVFNPGRNGSWKLRWNSIRVGASITIDTAKIQNLGSISFDKQPDVLIGIGYYATNTQVQVTATPIEGARFVRWFGDFPEGQMSNSVITLTMDQGKTLQPWFEPTRYLLTTTPILNPEGASVTAVPEPGVDGKYPADQMVTLTANDGDPKHPFRMWGFQDGLSHPDYTNRTITVCVEKAKKVRPIYAYDSWFYDGTYVIDGGWKIKKLSIKNTTQISVTMANSEANWDFAGDHELDMKKPIYDVNGGEYSFYGLENDMFRSDWAKLLVAQIETLRFGPDQVTVYGGNAFHSSASPFSSIMLWEISASAYTKAASPAAYDPTRGSQYCTPVMYFSSSNYTHAASQKLSDLPNNGDYKQLIRLNTKSECWKNFILDTTKVTPWRKLTAVQQSKFDPSYYGLPATHRPYGLILDGNGIFRKLLWVESDRNINPPMVLIIR